MGVIDPVTSALHIVIGEENFCHSFIFNIQPLAKVLAGVGCVVAHSKSTLSPKKKQKNLAGDSQPLDVCSVHQASAPLRYSVSLLGYGFYGDVLAESEKHRWMGPLRYDFSGTNC